ncbi:MAG: hypothetical protein WB988_00645 [Candidatus Nitrosopolaris sp.]
MSDIISWDKAIDKKVKSSDDKDLGKIQSVTRDYIQTKECAKFIRINCCFA